MENTSSTKIALKWGVILGIAVVIFSIITYIFEFWKISWVQLITYLLEAIMIFLGIREYKSENNSYLTIGDGLNIGALMGAILGLISGIFTFIYTTFIDTNFLIKVQDFTREQLLLDGKISEEQIEQVLEMSQKFQSPGLMFIFSIILFAIFGFIVALIFSLFMKKEKSVFE